MIAPEYFNGSRSFRAYQLYWRVKYGYWPGTLKKTCSTDKCLVHYEEKGHVLTPQDVQEIKDAPDSWGINTQLAKKYGVSNARITQIRGKRR